MLNQATRPEANCVAYDPARRGLHGLFRRDEVNHCPGCGRSSWLVGRFSAQCGFCSTALPLSQTNRLGAGTYWHAGSTGHGEWDVS